MLAHSWELAWSWRRSALARAACSSTPTACSLFVDTDGLVGGSALIDDAGSDAGDAAADTGLVDASRPDADAGADVDAAPLAYCLAHPGHTLCLDFDESTAVPAGASSFDPMLLYVDSTDSVSPLHSLLTTYPAGQSQQKLMLTLSGTGKLSFSLDMKLAASDLTIGQIIAFDIDLPDGPGVQDHSFYIETYDGNFRIGESVGPTDGGPTSYTATPLFDVVPNGAWSHLDVTVDGSTRAITLSIDGTPHTVAAAQAGFAAGTVYVNLGGYGNRLPNGATSAIDNLIVDP